MIRSFPLFVPDSCLSGICPFEPLHKIGELTSAPVSASKLIIETCYKSFISNIAVRNLEAGLTSYRLFTLS